MEHPFHFIKNLQRLKKVCYRGLGQEHDAAVYPVWPGQSGDCEDAVVRASGPRGILKLGNDENGHEKAAKPE